MSRFVGRSLYVARLRGIFAVVTVALLFGASRGTAQATQPGPIEGAVRSAAGLPIEHANVFLLETLEGDLTGPDGRFSITTARVGSATMLVQRIGYAEHRAEVTLPVRGPITITLTEAPVLVAPITVAAGRYGVGMGPDAAVTSLEVVATPGTAADAFRALQTFPGLQAVTEGAGLFVRGGDVAETKILLNDAVVLSPYRYESPTGSAFGAFDPFMLDGISFSSGGFGAEHGDALSGVVALETLGRPMRTEAAVTASLAALSGRVALALPGGFGARANATRTNTRLMFDLNGGLEEFAEVPEGRDLGGQLSWDFSRTGSVKVVGVDQWDRFAARVDAAPGSDVYDGERQSRLLVVSAREVVGSFAPSLSASGSESRRTREVGVFRLDQRERYWQGRARGAWQLRRDWTVRAGAEIERRESRLEGSVPDRADPSDPGARATAFASVVEGTRDAAFLELTWRTPGSLEVTGGLRSDHSSLTRTRTYDPRLAAAYRLGRAAVLTLAAGVYHHVPEPLFFEPAIGRRELPPMRARHWVAGLVLGDEDGAMLRLEAYRKSYRNLVDWTRDWAVHAGGRGRSSGLDIFVKGIGPWGIGGRVAYSLISAERTDPDTGDLARSPFDLTHTLVWTGERTWSDRFRLSVAYRFATGRPYTAVIGASFDDVRGAWTPQYGRPFAERLPAFHRLDASASLLHSFWDDNLTAFFVSVTNALDRRNVVGYRYGADYSERTPIRSAFRRTLYFGASTSSPL